MLYLHEIVVFSKFQNEHIDHVKQAMKVLNDDGVTVELERAILY